MTGMGTNCPEQYEAAATENESEDPNLQYKCKICHKRFKHSSALGGHISKAHPGQSSAYNHKKRVREMRELERELHRHTMHLYKENYATVGMVAGGTASKFAQK